MSFQEEYKRLKEEVTALTSQKASLERQVKDIKSLKKQRTDLLKDITRLEAELKSLNRFDEFLNALEDTPLAKKTVTKQE